MPEQSVCATVTKGSVRDAASRYLITSVTIRWLVQAGWQCAWGDAWRVLQHKRQKYPCVHQSYSRFPSCTSDFPNMFNSISVPPIELSGSSSVAQFMIHNIYIRDILVVWISFKKQNKQQLLLPSSHLISCYTASILRFSPLHVPAHKYSKTKSYQIETSLHPALHRRSLLFILTTYILQSWPPSSYSISVVLHTWSHDPLNLISDHTKILTSFMCIAWSARIPRTTLIWDKVRLFSGDGEVWLFRYFDPKVFVDVGFRWLG